MNPKYKRILVKLSGEAIGGTDGRGIDRSKLERVVEQLVKLSEENIEKRLINNKYFIKEISLFNEERLVVT